MHDDAWREERNRLGALEQALDPDTYALLDRIGVGAGWRCAEVGVGAGSVARWLCERVGPSGEVLATDVQTRLLRELDHPNLVVAQQDVVESPLPESAFDLVHVRWMLHWPPARRRVLTQLVSALRPGGWLLAEEPDFVTMIEGASSDTLRTVVGAAVDLHERASGGMDSRYGRHLPADLAACDVTDLSTATRVHLMRGGDDRTGTGLAPADRREGENPPPRVRKGHRGGARHHDEPPHRPGVRLHVPRHGRRLGPPSLTAPRGTVRRRPVPAWSVAPMPWCLPGPPRRRRTCVLHCGRDPARRRR